MKTFSKIFLVLALFTATSFADDGHTSGGGKAAPPCTVNCPTSLVQITPVSTSEALPVNASKGLDEDNTIISYLADLFFEIFV